MTSLILIRHAAVQIDRDVPAKEWRLSANGRARTRQLAPHLLPYSLRRIITSIEPKARETGQILAATLGLPRHTAVNLHEHDREGVPYFARHEDFVTAVTRFFARPDELVLGRETAVQARERFDMAVSHLAKTYPAENIALVAHGTVITLFICHYNRRLNPTQFWQEMRLPAVFFLSAPPYRLKSRLLLGENGSLYTSF